MKVSFTKTDAKRYAIAIEREKGPALVPRFAPGYDDRMPHDLAHFVVEECFEIELGVWGQLAAGGGGIFTPAPEDNNLRYQRRAQRIAAIGRDDMARSEGLVVMTVPAWERTIGRATHPTRETRTVVDPEALGGAVRQMGDLAVLWHRLPHGGSLTLEWPQRLTFDAARSRRGRRHRDPVATRR